jgi:membrane-bound lytic murein transglycosylase A
MEIKNRYKLLLYLAYLVPFLSCANLPRTVDINNAMRPSRFSAKELHLQESLEINSLVEAIEAQVSFFNKNSTVAPVMRFGPSVVERTVYMDTLKKFAEELKSSPYPSKNIAEIIDKYFVLYEVAGQKDWADVLASGYYDPIIKGSEKPTSVYSQPLYKTPKDLVIIDADLYANTFDKFKELQKIAVEQKSNKRIIRGRMAEDKTIVPYYSRREIDIEGKLKGKGLELCWVDPVEALFLRIQGSGTVVFSDGKKISVGYDSQNGHPYSSMGKLFISKNIMPKEKLSMQSIKAYLRSIPAKEAAELMVQDASYVFFRKIDGKSLSYLGTELVPQRTIATDQTIFPKGAMAFLDIEEPVLKETGDMIPSDYTKKPRLVLDQDTGGAIRGPARLDLYFGAGEEAGQKAGVMRRNGRLYYLVPR